MPMLDRNSAILRPQLRDVALVVGGVAEGHAVAVGEPDLDPGRAAGHEGADLLAGEHEVSRVDGGGDALVDEDHLAGVGAVEQPVEDAAPAGPARGARSSGSAPCRSP